MDEFFYGTLPQDTQDFSQVLRGVGRNIQDIGRGVSYYPYDLVGAPVDLINMALTPVGLGSERPVLGSDYLRNIAQSLKLAQPSTGSGTETAARFASALINPAAGARAVGKVGSDINRLISMIDETPPRGSIDFSPRQVSSAQQVAQEIMQPKRSDIGFYSQLEAATFPMQDKGTGDQFLAQIQKTAGVKPEEIKYTGLDDFLKGKKSVTKTEIQDYLNANRVDVQEVRLLGSAPLTEQAFNERFARRGFSMVQTDDGPRFRQTDMTGSRQLTYGELPEDIQATIERQSVPQTKHHLGAYQGIKTEIPGGENYREILLTLPNAKGALSAEEKLRMEFLRHRKTSGAYDMMKGEKVDELAGLEKRYKGTEYKSTHFDQPNVLAHMRVNDRTVDGKKTLFIEEIQSDWHQAGRKKGYDTLEARAAEQQKLDNILTERQTLLDEQRRLEELAQPFTSQGRDAPSEIVDQWSIVSNRLNNLQTEQNRLGRGFGQQVPDAPFKTTWHELTLKRAIQEASEKGYDQIAFTTGKTQAERYDLSKQVNSLKVERNTTGNYSLRIKRTDADKTFEPLKSNVPESELPDYIGKDLAQKIIEEGSGSKDFSKVYSGLDLQVGGEGMKGFYDNILPKSLEKLGKKFDAKVGKTEMDGVEVWQMDITPKMRESVTTKGQPLFAVPAAGLLGAGMSQDEQMY